MIYLIIVILILELNVMMSSGTHYSRTGRGWSTLTFAVEQEVLHIVAERNVHVAAIELAGQAAAVEWRDGVGAVRGRKQPL